jgi:hypothetical protein
MKMLPTDYRVYWTNGPDLFLISYFSGMTDEWPPIVRHDNRDYKFASQEFMETWMVGQYSGHAKYVLTQE